MSKSRVWWLHVKRPLKIVNFFPSNAHSFENSSELPGAFLLIPHGKVAQDNACGGAFRTIRCRPVIPCHSLAVGKLDLTPLTVPQLSNRGAEQLPSVPLQRNLKVRIANGTVLLQSSPISLLPHEPITLRLAFPYNKNSQLDFWSIKGNSHTFSRAFLDLPSASSSPNLVLYLPLIKVADTCECSPREIKERVTMTPDLFLSLPQISATWRSIGTVLGTGYIHYCLNGRKRHWFAEHGFDYVCRMKAEPRGFNGSKLLEQSPSCTGKEESLSYCQWKSLDPEEFRNVDFAERALVKCTDVSDFHLRLTGGSIPSEGFVMVKCDASEDWSVLCGNFQWDIRDCMTVCRQLGYKTCTRVSHKLETVWGKSDVIWEDIKCGFEESHLLDCDKEIYDTCNVDWDGVAWMSCGVEVTVMGTETILCGPEHSCRNRCGTFWRNGSGCHCDAVCNVFEDCCVDFEEFCDGNDNVHTSSMDHIQFSDPNLVMSSKCVDISGTRFEELGYVLVAKCPPNYPQLGSVYQCEHNPVAEDVLAKTPVRDSIGVVYKNVYCAICHGRKVEELSPWNVVRISTDNSRDTLEDFLGEILDGVPSQEIYYIAKPHFAEWVRPCRASWSSHCSVKRSDLNMTILAESTSKCGTYYAPIRLSVLPWRTYQNPDCLVCTGLYHMDDVPPRGYGYCHHHTGCHCSPLGSTGCRCHKNSLRTVAEVSVEFNISKLTQLGPAGTKQRCLGEGAVYDPFLDKCRVLECPEYYSHLGSTCVPSSLPPNGSITARIAGEKFNEGFVEILHFGKWYAALKHLFDEYARMVLCRELGLNYEPTYFFPARNRSSFTGWYAIRINCTGSEPNLNNCITSFTSSMASNTSSGEVFVSCVDKSETKIRLVGGRLPSEGFVQITFGKDDTLFPNSKQWYYLLGDTDHWDYRDGSVVCRELELGPCASTDRRPVSSVDATLYAVTREMFCDRFHDVKLSDCFSQAVFVDEINKLAWVTCSIEAVVNNISFQLCGSIHTCLNRCGHWDGHCNCDSSCEAFGDCCFDYKKLCEAETTTSEPFTRPFPTKIPTEKYSCLVLEHGLPDFFVVASCPDFWAPDVISDLCERGRDAEFEEIFLWVPVFDLEGVVYLNRFCAICNGISTENMTNFPFTMNGDEFEIDIPQTGLGVPRLCITHMQSGCYDNNWDGDANKTEDRWSDVSQRACSEVFAPVAVKDHHDVAHFRNKFCAECEFSHLLSDPIEYCTLDQCSTEPSDITDTCIMNEIVRTIGVLLSINNPDDVSCERPGETIHPIIGTCIFTGCPSEFFHHSGVCVKGKPPFNAPQIVLAKTIHETHSCIESVIAENTNLALETTVCSILSNTSYGPFTVTITGRDIWGFMYAYTLLHNVSATKNVSFYHQCAAGVLHLNIRSDNFTNQPPCSHEIRALNPVTSPCLRTGELEILSFKFNPDKRAYDTVIHVSSACFEKVMEPVECRPLQAKLGYDKRENEFIFPDYLFWGMTSPPTSSASDGYVVCSYRRTNDRVWAALFMVTKCCLVSSAVGITLSITTYVKFSQNLGVTDFDRMQQLSSLIVVYAFQFFNTYSILESPFCKYLAMVSHFAFLSHIAWTLLIFHKMYLKFKYQLGQSLITFRETGRKLYNGFATWGLSLIIVLVCFFLDQCNCTPGLIVRYSSNGYTCWVEDDIAIIVTVCIPVGVLILFSLISSIYSFYTMWKIQPSLQRFKQAGDVIKELNRELVENCWNFFGLVVVAVQGLAAFILSSSSSPPSSLSTIFTFVFLVTSALYGTLLSVVFLMKRDAKNLWLDCLCRTGHAKASAPETDGES
ncbi:Lysyl oxidase-like 3 [Holothuria leucospilota]|uniref:Lysyl oxidase-like 3 n=1 Tax=Holothuria leucospilota TaxID=206669 RepID=A0A9Q1GYX8_HOLLE|nr:Lysyl oxidase-like 3 [Holothuria leucospilota]